MELGQRKIWSDHLRLEHGLGISGEGIGGEAYSCPLCLESIPQGTILYRHIAKHLEEISLATLPRGEDSTDDLEGTADVVSEADPDDEFIYWPPFPSDPEQEAYFNGEDGEEGEQGKGALIDAMERWLAEKPAEGWWSQPLSGSPAATVQQVEEKTSTYGTRPWQPWKYHGASSYWSKQEKDDTVMLLQHFGTDYDTISSSMSETKTPQMVSCWRSTILWGTRLMPF